MMKKFCLILIFSISLWTCTKENKVHQAPLIFTNSEKFKLSVTFLYDSKSAFTLSLDCTDSIKTLTILPVLIFHENYNSFEPANYFVNDIYLNDFLYEIKNINILKMKSDEAIKVCESHFEICYIDEKGDTNSFNFCSPEITTDYNKLRNAILNLGFKTIANKPYIDYLIFASRYDINSVFSYELFKEPLYISYYTCGFNDLTDDMKSRYGNNLKDKEIIIDLTNFRNYYQADYEEFRALVKDLNKAYWVVRPASNEEKLLKFNDVSANRIFHKSIDVFKAITKENNKFPFFRPFPIRAGTPLSVPDP